MSFAGRLKAVLGLDNGPFKRGLGDAKGSVRGFVGAVRGMIGPLAVAMGAALSVNAVRGAMANIDAQAKLARSLGTSVSSMQVLERAADLTGVSMGQVEQGTIALTKRLSQAAQGSGPAVKALAMLKLNAEGLQQLPLDERLIAIQEAMEKYVPAAQRAAVASDLFGARAGVIFSRLDGAALRQAKAEMEAFGFALSETDAAKVEEANDAISKIGLTTSALGNRLAVSLAPFLKEVSQGFAELLRGGGALNLGLAAIGQQISSVTSVAFDLIRIAGAAASEFVGWVQSLSEGEGAVAGFLGLAGSVVSIFQTLFQGVGKGIGFFADLIETTGGFGEALTALKPVAAEVWDRMKLGAQSMAYAVAARWGDIKAAILEALDGAIDGTVTFGNRAIGAFVGAYKGIKTAWSKLPAAIGDLVIQAANSVVGGVESLLNGVVTRINSFLEKINTILAKLPDWAGGQAKVGLLDEVSFEGLPNKFAGEAADAGAAAGEAFSEAFNQRYFDPPSTGLRGSAASERGLANTYRGIAESLRDLAASPLSSIEALRQQVTEAAAEAESALGDTKTASDDLGNSLQNTGSSGSGALKKVKDSASKVADGLKGMRSAGKSAFVELVTGAKSLKQALADMFAKWAQIGASNLFDSLFPGGGLLSKSQSITGLISKAGSKQIMPLSRMGGVLDMLNDSRIVPSDISKRMTGGVVGGASNAQRFAMSIGFDKSVNSFVAVMRDVAGNVVAEASAPISQRGAELALDRMSKTKSGWGM
ncbi:Phage-related protein [Thalassovita gelatinovora]|uniref:Phage-related protein n=1 Tax=Thalassovita gelatinovora TaxID=53501 RepID=A0A0P1FF90_THAGE|nr:hypothetical protein [Thalassovita gelatinovora]QIZ79777.1 phage tail tape measure protein [Thalassovita gelatinovora]CUH66809.1 Phage-related protein [Thalassovita gelatinovora]SEQ43150.1 hypothetical protein SAMN04488043_105189 [Thalassovita gelatinovora]